MLYWEKKKWKKTSSPHIGDCITYHPNYNIFEGERGTIYNYVVTIVIARSVLGKPD